MKDNKIKFNKDREGAIARLAGYYDQINKQYAEILPGFILPFKHIVAGKCTAKQVA